MMSRHNGSMLSEAEHIQQSLEDISTTPIGTRIMRREYGTQLADLIDQPISEALYLKIYSTLYLAYLRWEDRIEISQMQVAELKHGRLILDITGFLKSTAKQVNLSIRVKLGAMS